MANLDTNTLCYEGTDLILLKKNTDSTEKFSETDIINMLEFFLVIIGGRVFQQTVGISMGTNYDSLLSFIRMRQTSYRGFSRKTKRS
jgi:hypothetical protein